MSIQSNVNQIISLASLLYSQTDAAKTAADVRRVNKEIKATQGLKQEAVKGLKTQLGEVEDGLTGEEIALAEDDAGIMNEADIRLGELHGRLAAIKPTEKNVEAYSEAKVNAQEAKARQDDPSTALYSLKDGGISMTRLQKQQQMAAAAQDAGTAEAQRIANSNMLDLSKLDDRTVDRVNRAYKKAEHDSYYLRKNNPKGGNQ